MNRSGRNPLDNTLPKTASVGGLLTEGPDDVAPHYKLYTRTRDRRDAMEYGDAGLAIVDFHRLAAGIFRVRRNLDPAAPKSPEDAAI